MSSRHEHPWWRDAVIYQVYPRSFADGNGDGLGDLAGLRERLPYLRDLGVDAIWLSPWYVSPMADAGYDVADYRDIDPVFGTLAEAELFITEAHQHRLRVIVDIVPNHCSDRHPRFQAALAAGPGSPERELFWFRPGRGEHGELPPTDWGSHFGGPAWTRVPDGEWYLHMFAPEQPDWNWDHPAVREDFQTTLRFWLDRGVDGFRIDVADHLVKDPTLPDLAGLGPDVIRPWRDQEGVHEIYRDWRKIADSYPQRGVFVGELWDDDPDRFTRYLRPDELHTGFNFPFLSCPWDAAAFRDVIDTTLATHAMVGAPATWVLSNHDVVRHATRYGRAHTAHSFDDAKHVEPSDLVLGTRRARAAALLTLALPGSAYVYQGEELGLPEVEDIPAELLQDPRWPRSGFTDRGRDGCRVPLPWSGQTKPYGFSPDQAVADPWLPQPASWAALSAAAQTGDRRSMLELYRRALHVRRTEPDLGDGPLKWLPAPDGVLHFQRGNGFACLVNLGDTPADLPPYEYLLLTSDPLEELKVAPNSAVWLRTA
ncbi:glycoside hydrolase family 13 protein [Catellatospora paridis]|uniref:glycoside hydrolase family 13 protein n=1 Tax=Catellatospora paridis TaxID=1617086 RepID=UPI0012D43CC1|nr:glycoside hydrolase family 13 protein [Catellatospora paridis]